MLARALLVSCLFNELFASWLVENLVKLVKLEDLLPFTFLDVVHVILIYLLLIIT